MKYNSRLVMLVGLLLLAIGLLAGYLFGNTTPDYLLGINKTFDLVVLSLVVFIVSVLFFGYLTPLVFLFFGFRIGTLMRIDLMLGTINLIYILPMIFAAYAGTVLGKHIRLDLMGEDNLFDQKIRIIKNLLRAVFLAVIVSIL
ncbi:MAG: hypothetical protein Q7K42_05165 [Candidatus Diapherotrites archaeon]|nr:hypothetical protein [Candidatus Diapherotrites archaeon]